VDLIVMCSRGYTGLKRWMEGSETQKLAAKAPVPILVLHAGGGKLLNFPCSDSRPARVLVLLDGTSEAETVVVPAANLSAALCTPFQGTLHLAQCAGPYIIHASTVNYELLGHMRLPADRRYQLRSDEIDPRWNDHFFVGDGL
jgi:hypothetical protein